MVVGVTAAIVASDLDRYWPLDLRDPPGVFTQWRIRALAASPDQCRRVLARSEIEVRAASPRPLVGGCGYVDGVVPTAASVALDAPPAMRCALAAAVAAWERRVVEPAALKHLGSKLVEIRHFGSYSCRNVYGRATGRRSQHATANALDVAAFRLADGRTISVLGDWSDGGARGAFLREVRDGACDLFAGVLSPDYNAAHRDHFHFDLGPYDVCR